MSGTPNAAVHIEDRGYQFADGVYEVCEVARGFIMDMTRHLDRLNRSLGELEIAWPMSRKALETVMREVVKRNHVVNGLVYLQVTRGVAQPRPCLSRRRSRPALVVTAKRSDPAAALKRAETGPQGDHRAGKPLGPRRHQDGRPAAQRAGQAEGQARRRPRSLVRRSRRHGQGGRFHQCLDRHQGRQAGHPPGRAAASCAASPAPRCSTLPPSSGSTIEERGFTVAEAKAAREAFITAATTVVMPVVAIDGDPVANGHPGSIALSLRSAFFDVAEKTRA